MQPRAFVLLLTLALLLVVGLFAIRERSHLASEKTTVSSERTDTARPAAAAEGEAGPVADQRQISGTRPMASTDAAAVSPQALGQDTATTNQESYTEARVAELMDIAMTDDPGNLQTILSELTNRDPEIRKAARDAAVQFGSRDAIPKLLEAANFTDDPKEKSEFAEAAEFLKLPSLTEISAQSARGQNPAPAAPGSKPFSPKAKTAAQVPPSPK
jgi:hypothetical protein